LDKVQDKFTTQTLVMSKSNKLVFHSFEYNKLDSLQTMRSLAPSCPMLPTVLWDLRNIKAAIHIDYGGPDLHNEWVARNYKSLQGIFEGLGYPCYKGHFFGSKKSWEAVRSGQGLSQAKRAKLEDKGEPVIGQNCMEEFCCSTVATVYGLLHWNKRLSTQTSRDSSMTTLKGFLDSTLQGNLWTLWLDPDNSNLGEIANSGTHVLVSGSNILDCSGLAKAFPEIGSALGRTSAIRVINDLSALSFLVYQCIFSRKKSREELVYGDSSSDRGNNVSVQIHTLLKWLFGKTSSLFANLFWQLLVYVSCMVDLTGAVAESSADALDLPQPVGPMGRAARMPQAKKHLMAKIAAKSRLLRSGRAVAEALQLLRNDQEGFATLSANKWVAKLAWQYLHNAQAIMKLGLSEPIYSISWDATRLSKRDTLIATLYNSMLDKAIWCPPQVGFFVVRLPNRHSKGMCVGGLCCSKGSSVPVLWKGVVIQSGLFIEFYFLGVRRV
jgi:hypothetical protein